MPDFTPAQNAAFKVARAGDFIRLKKLLEGPDVIKDSNKLSNALREKRILGYDDHDRISIEYLYMAAAGIGHAEMLRYLLSLYPYPGDSLPDRVLHNAINSSSTETVQVLLDLDPPVVLNHHLKKTMKPLDYALCLDRRQDALHMTEFLLEHGADPNFGGSSTIYSILSHMEHAILSSWPKLVQLLIRYGAKSYSLEEELRLLPKAAGAGQLEAVIRLVDKGADIHGTGEPPHYNETPLYLAVHRRKTEIVKYLLRAGADPNKPNPNGSTPLKWARENALKYSQCNEIVDLLVEYGARDT